MVLQDCGDESDNQKKGGPSLNEFECPLCAANNPCDDGLVNGEEIRCCYCGSEFRIHISDEGKLKLKET